MKKHEIKVNSTYTAKVSPTKTITVKVESISNGLGGTVYHTTNVETGESIPFASALKFQAEVSAVQSEVTTAPVVSGGEEPKANYVSPGEDTVSPLAAIASKVKAPKAKVKVKLDAPKPEGKTVMTLPETQEEPTNRVLPTDAEDIGLNTKKFDTDADQQRLADMAEAAKWERENPKEVQEIKDSTKEWEKQHGGFRNTKPPIGGLAAKLTANKAKEAQPIVGEPHLIVTARAGTGKTTTLCSALQVLMGAQPTTVDHEKRTVPIVPSNQQKAVWDAVALSRGKAKSVCFVAFNKSIATELQARVPSGCSAMTMHSMGFGAVRNSYGNSVKVEEYRLDNILSEIMGKDIRELRKNNGPLVQATKHLVNLCKMNLTIAEDVNELAALVSHYEVELEGVSAAEVYDLVPRVLERCMNVQKDGCIDYSDMIWVPIVNNLPIRKYDLLLVDEAQDLNRCQQELAKRAGNRLVLCGDPRQAIYGFAGADADSMPRMKRELAETTRGVMELPLTMTRRCGKAIVAEAQRLVPDFEAHESNGTGVISRAAMKAGEGTTAYQTLAKDGDMVLCRVNAPLVSECFRFLKSGRKANIQGRDVGKGLISTVTKMKVENVPDLVGKLDDWLSQETAKENAKRTPSEARLIAFQDRYDCIICFTEGCTSVAEVIRKIEAVFTDDKNAPGIRLSSIHKAKGLESNRVFFLRPKGAECPHPMAKSAWQREQENNLVYVATTRAISELVYVA